MPANILIADDYEDNRELLRLILASADYEVREARDGQECLRMAKEQDQRTCSIPCVAVTAHAEPDRERALKAGFTDYLSKPFRSGELLETVRRLLLASAVKVEAAKASEP